MIVLYGIPNCDTVRKARRWLDAHGVAYRFHDLRRDGLDKARLRRWCDAVGWEALLNRRGRSWRQLPEEIRARMDDELAREWMGREPTLIRRPVIEWTDGTLTVGFSEETLAAHAAEDA